MEEYANHLKIYSSKAFFTCSSLNESDWGNEELAKKYLEKYWLPQEEYERVWKPIQDKIFINQEKGLPELIFNENYEMLILRGGLIFTETDFKQLQSCILSLPESFFVIIENPISSRTEEPRFRMKYPIDITWKELTSGNYISSVLFEWPIKEYFVFGSSGLWGKYVANDYEHPLDVLGFKKEHEILFRKKFKVSKTESQEIFSWLPPKYKEYKK